MKNKFEIRGEVTAILLNSRKYGKMETLISTSKLERVKELDGTWVPTWDKRANKFYVKGNFPMINRKQEPSVRLHRWITNAPTGMVVDHIMHDGLNNTDDNLRVVTYSENSFNRKGPQSNNKSGIRGVIWDNYANKWRAFISINGKQKYIGNFIELEDAEDAANAARNMPGNKAV
jgi:hypothetical protein